jgi:hypothetical protein
VPEYLVVYVGWRQLGYADEGPAALTNAINQHVQAGWVFVSLTPLPVAGAYVTFSRAATG